MHGRDLLWSRETDAAGCGRVLPDAATNRPIPPTNPALAGAAAWRCRPSGAAGGDRANRLGLASV
ncbi:Hypothetical protein I596_3261 [Dokdonella koreensis DS-123]|uniref:Uncharacterized protein n=1 Tax=Dokdonella koreensis DS-123 TaxID=1300342 RepID=A0A160DXX6_9GAMM|nr:Hypothetical protein I596_3261 [Dokdonella koreensis DS-123]